MRLAVVPFRCGRVTKENKMTEKPKKLLPDMGEIDKLVLMLQEAVSKFNDTRQYVDEALHTIQTLLDRLAGLDELRAYIEPQGPIQVVVPLRAELPRAEK